MAQPHEDSILALKDKYAVIHGDDRKILEKAVRDPGQRSITTITPDLAPKTKDGGAAKSPMSWLCTNTAVKAANENKKAGEKLYQAVSQVFCNSFDAVTTKPLDVDGFEPQLKGAITAQDISDILGSGLID